MTTRARSLLASFAVGSVLVIGAWVRLSRMGPPEDPRFFTLGGLARELSKDPATYDAAIESLGGGRDAVGVITPAHKAFLRQLFQQHDYAELDQQPQLTLDGLRTGLATLALQRPFAEHRMPPTEPKVMGLQIPTGKSAPTGEPYLREIGLHMKWGDRLDPDKAKRAGDSARLAQVLDELSMGEWAVDGHTTPTQLLTSLISQGHTVSVVDQRLAANFGDLERNDRPVATPLWLLTGRASADGQPLLLPVPHAQLVLLVRGPTVNAEVTFYPALDLVGDGSGGARFRPDVTADQNWTGGWVAHRYEGEQAMVAVELMALMRRELVLKENQYRLPLDGYFALGVCTLAPAVVEQKLFGHTTLWPLTHDPQYFAGDGELDTLVKALPVDGRGGAAPDDARLSGSIAWRSIDEVPFRFARPQLAAMNLLPATADAGHR